MTVVDERADGDPTPAGPDAVATGPVTTLDAVAAPPAVADGNAAVVPVENRTRPLLTAAGVVRWVGIVLSLLAVLFLGFVSYLVGVSGLQQARTQETLRTSFRHDLEQALAPVGPTTAGRPVAILQIPTLHLRQVVVEGTTPGDLTRGPGHSRNTALPGQAGVSAILGRRSTFGAPFARLGLLRAGDRIEVTTGQGVATYRVTGLRRSRDSVVLADLPANRLTLSTSDPALHPDESLLVDAALSGTPQPSPAGNRPFVDGPGRSLGRDAGSVAVPLLLWCQVLVAAVAVTTWCWLRWHRWPTYLAMAPALLAIVWNVYENAAQMLPNTL